MSAKIARGNLWGRRTRDGLCHLCLVFFVGSLILGIASGVTNFEEEDSLRDPAVTTYETDDAYVTDVVIHRRLARSTNNGTGNERSRRQISNWQNLILGPCITSQGRLGRCTSFRNCYPYFKVPELSNYEAWVLGVYDTCSYFTERGEQAFGICCSQQDQVRPSPMPTAGPSPPREENPDSGNPIPPNWPPPVPTHPPDHTAATHPPYPGYPTVSTPPTPPRPVPTLPTRPSTLPTRPPVTRPTPTTMRWPPPLPTHPPLVTTRPPLPTTRPTLATTRPTTAIPPWQQPTTARPIAPPAPDNEIVDNSCGAKNGYQDQERIVGGQNADVGEWPWIAALFNSGRQFCGGSLIDNEHILTAAHCVAHMSSWDVARMTVRLGDHNIRTNSETKHIEKKVKRVVRHKGFDARTLYNDVAVLTLESPVTYSKNIRPICLPSGGSNYAGQPATVIGWGSLRESGSQPAVLQEVSIPIWTNENCRQKYGHAAPGGIIESFLCAGQPSRDSCSGDSGGPLMVNQGRWTQVGIVSWGIGCGKGQYPGVYTRVTNFMSWINKNLK